MKRTHLPSKEKRRLKLRNTYAKELESPLNRQRIKESIKSYKRLRKQDIEVDDEY